MLHLNGGKPRARRIAGALGVVAVLGFLIAQPTFSQSAESADAGHGLLWVGGGVSAATLEYGNRKMLAGTAWADADTLRRFGFEGEARWLDFHQTADVHAETYLIGMRYHLNYRRYQPYAKALVGTGHFNFPYNFGFGNYLVVAYGGGLDYRLNGRFKARAEFEYQQWPEFTFGSMNSIGATLGLRYRIF